MTRGPKIAVVEDDEAVRDSIVSLIGALDMTPRPYASAQEFLDAKGWTDTACLLTDVRMPGIDGVLLYQTLLRKGIRLPVIFMSALNTDSVRERVMHLGATSILRKPLIGSAFLSSVRAALEQASTPQPI